MNLEKCGAMEHQILIILTSLHSILVQVMTPMYCLLEMMDVIPVPVVCVIRGMIGLQGLCVFSRGMS